MSITNVNLQLVGEDGNAFAILGRAKQALRKAGQSEHWDAYYAEATSGDYDHLLSTTLDYFNCDPIDDEDYWFDEDEE